MIILSNKADLIAEMLPGASRKGCICFYKSNDLLAVKLAASLARAKVIILVYFHVGHLIESLIAVATICAFYQAIQIRLSAPNRIRLRPPLALPRWPEVISLKSPYAISGCDCFACCSSSDFNCSGVT